MSQKSKCLGLLGLGSHSTAFYLEQLNAEYNRLNGGYSTCPLKMMNINFDAINPYLPHDFKILEPIVSESILEVHKLGIECLVVPNITLHETIDRLNLKEIQIIHPVRETAKKLRLKGVNEVVLIGSIFTMEGSYISNIFSEYSIKTIQPSTEDKVALDKLRKRVYENGASNKFQVRIKKIIEEYIRDTPIVIGCTELSMLLENYKSTRLYDVVRIQIEKAIEKIN